MSHFEASPVGKTAWVGHVGGSEQLADALRSAMRDDYANASTPEMAEALDAIFESMSPAEAFSLSSALKQIGTGADKLLSDPTFIQVASTAAPIVLGAAGTALGGPAGTALGAGLGNIAANALSSRAAPRHVGPQPSAAAPTPSAAAMPPPIPPAATGGPPFVSGSLPTTATLPVLDMPPPVPAPTPVAGGSAAAARAVVLSQHPDVLRSLLATALGRQGGKESSGIPVAQIVTLFSQAVAEAAADADELMYLAQDPDRSEGAPEDASTSSAGSLYTELLGADNYQLARAVGWNGLDR